MKDYFGNGAIALVRGLIRGMGREAACELLARRRPLPDTDKSGIRRYEYSQFSIVQAPAEFPDGDYTVITEDGQQLPVSKFRGLWMIQQTEESGSASEECA
ncbi:MAG: hypothetical protein WCA44_06690 [Acidobacteriaceae bacterium]|jgi:hypothetical protein